MTDRIGLESWYGSDSYAVIGANDKDYDCESGVPDMGMYVSHWLDNSVAARAELTSALGLRFGQTKEEYVDVFPAEKPGAPVMIFIHGGWWRIGTAEFYSCIAKGFVPHGVTTVIMNYALCPYVSIDEITRQARAAVSWVYKNIDRYNGDPNKIYVSGHSAGGNLTSLCMETDWSRYEVPADVIKAGVPISGVFDLRPLRYSFLQPWLQLDGGQIERNSPQLHHPEKTDAPQLIVVGGGESEGFIAQSKSYFDLWTHSGNAAEYFEVPDANHFEVTWELEDPGSELVARILKLMDRR